jgi:translation initiation factor IF-3
MSSAFIHSLAKVNKICYAYLVIKRPRINNQITAAEMRVVGNKGENFGVLRREEALIKAKELELDLIEIAPTAVPPVAKIMDFGKYLYQQEKKSKSAEKAHKTETKEIQIGINISPHDMELKAKRADEFLKQGDRVNINLILRGREKGINRDFVKERLNVFLRVISEKYKIADGPKSGPRGLSTIIEKII